MITLASDFGSPYPAAMRGVLCRESDARLVDVSHDLPRGAVRESAFWLRETLPTFPPSTHLAVVDPGVGTGRGVLVGRARGHAFVGPDNGLLVPAARRVADDGGVDWFHADPGEPASSTFHGRDVFAPLAATVHETVRSRGIDALGGHSRLSPAEPTALELPEATVHDGVASGEVLAIDDFGNVVTNVPGAVLDGLEGAAVTVDGDRVPVGETFASVGSGEPVVAVGSHGYVECDVNQGSGAERFGLATGDTVRIAGVDGAGL
jgi:S-adenosylmethionine hydrolase